MRDKYNILINGEKYVDYLSEIKDLEYDLMDVIKTWLARVVEDIYKEAYEVGYNEGYNDGIDEE